MSATGDYLKRIREQRGITKYALERDADIPAKDARRIENGERFPGVETTLRFARAYDLTPLERQHLLRHVANDLVTPYRTPLNQMRGGQP